MENEVKKSAGKVWLVPTILAVVLLIGLVVFMVIMGKGTSALADGTVTLAEAVSPLQDGTAQLSDGVDQYTGGVDTMNEAMPTLTEGVQQYTEGVDTLNGYMAKLNEAAPVLASGVQQLADGSTSLKAGVDQYTGGTDQVADGIAMLNDNVPTLTSGIKQLVDGAKQLNEGVNGKDGKGLKSSEQNLANGMQGLSDGTALLLGNVKDLKAQAYSNKDAIAAAKTIYTAYTNGKTQAEMEGNAALAIQEMLKPYAEANQAGAVVVFCQTALGRFDANKNGTIDAEEAGIDQSIVTNTQYIDVLTAYATYGDVAGAEVKVGAQQIVTGLGLTWSGTQATDQATCAQAIASLNGANVALNQLKTQLETYLAQYAAAQQAKTAEATPVLGNVVTVMCGYAGTAGNIDALIAGVDQLNTGASKLNTGVNGDGTKKNPGLSSGMSQLYGGLVTMQKSVPDLAGGIKQLFDGSQQLKANSAALRDGSKQLADGVGTLNSSVNGKDGLVSSVAQLYNDGSNKLAENSQALRDGVKQLADGAKQLADNSQALRDGAAQLKDAAPALIDGIGQLKDGAKKVNGFTPIH